MPEVLSAHEHDGCNLIELHSHKFMLMGIESQCSQAHCWCAGAESDMLHLKLKPRD